MQDYIDIASSEIISQSWAKFKTNDMTLMSNHSGTAFPAHPYIQIGMLCYRTDTEALYQCTGFNDVSNEFVWTKIVDHNYDYNQVVAKRADIASQFNFNDVRISGIYRVVVPSSAWGNVGYRPFYTDPVTSQTTYASNNGILVVSTTRDSVFQQYVDVETGDTYTRAKDDDKASFTTWARNWNEYNLTKVGQLENDKRYISGITATDVTKALGFAPVNAQNIHQGTDTSPNWNNSIPVISTAGKLNIGRYIIFHPTTGSSATTVTLDGGALNSTTLTLTGSLLATGDVTGFSDERLKDDIQVIENALDKVKQIRGVTFYRKDLPKDTPRQTGVIAQEVQKVLPEAVKELIKPNTNDKRYLSVAYGNMIGLLVEAIKEQQAIIEKLAKTCGVDLNPPKKRTRKTSAKKRVEQ